MLSIKKKRNLPIPTPDGGSAPQNRRVEIIVRYTSQVNFVVWSKKRKLYKPAPAN